MDCERKQFLPVSESANRSSISADIRGYYATLTLEFDDQVSLDDALYTAGRLTKELRIGAVKFDWDKGAVTYYVNRNGTVLQKIKSEVTTVMRPGTEGGAA